jgi:SAM-dependent methyltransferase
VQPGAVQRNAVQRNYGDTARFYAERWADQLAGQARELVGGLSLAGARAVLDLGCGPGRLLPHLAEQAPAAHVVGADITEAMLALAPQSFARVVGDAQALPFRGAAFDAVVMSFVLPHLAEPFVGLSELHRVVRPGGVVGLLTWGAATPPAAYDAWLDCVEAAGAPPDPRPMMHTTLDTTDQDAMRTAVGSAGFAEVRVRLRPFRWQPSLPEFLEHSLSIGVAARRVALLPCDARRACIAAARERLAALSDDDFLREATVLHTTGWRPTGAPCSS